MATASELDDLARCLRAWRDRLDPADVGLPAGAGRRVPGLRREELAQLAGVSLDYLARLEQGRARTPSASVLAALGRALRLTDDELRHLLRLAGHSDTTGRTISNHIGPGIQRMLDRLSDVPVLVIDATWQVVAANPLATALVGELTGDSWRARNLAWRHFTGAPSRLVRSESEVRAADIEIAAGLRDALSRHPADTRLRALVEDLRSVSDRFAAAWDQHPVGRRSESRKTFRHPEVGDITLDCDVLAVDGTDLRLVIYTAPAGSADADALALLAHALGSIGGPTRVTSGVGWSAHSGGSMPWRSAAIRAK